MDDQIAQRFQMEMRNNFIIITLYIYFIIFLLMTKKFFYKSNGIIKMLKILNYFNNKKYNSKI